MDTHESSDDHNGRVTAPKHYFTHDAELIEHIITDETLTQLAYGGRDISLEIAVAALGVAVGFSQNFVSAIDAIHNGEAIGGWDGFGAALFVVGATTVVLAGVSYNRTRIEIGALVARIRGRKRGVIESDEPYAAGRPYPGDPTISADTSSTTD